MYEFGREEIDAVTAVMENGQFFRYRGGEQGQVNTLERTMCKLMGCRHSLAVTSGTSALICGLVGLGVGPGDEVIVPAYTWLASAGAVLGVGAIPVLVDIDESLTLDPKAFAANIGPRTKAVIPVHMGGHPADMDQIMEVARENGVGVLEDACQAIGGSYKGQRLGAIGDAGAFSFNQFKIITSGEGGALFTNDPKIYERGLYHHDMGCTFREHCAELQEEEFLGNTYRMNEIQGAMLNVQFGRLEGILARLRQRREWLASAILLDGSPIVMSPSHDLDGDCGCSLTFTFGSAEARVEVAKRFGELSGNKHAMSSPIDSGLHVYTNWDVLLNRKGSHHPSLNPFLMRENEGCRRDIGRDSCLKTLNILGRTGQIAISMPESEEECRGKARLLSQAAKDVLGG